MTRQEVIENVCETVGIIFVSRKDYRFASDCFCKENPGFNHEGYTLEYLRQAVIEKLQRDGYEIVMPPEKRKCDHNEMVENDGPEHAWKCAKCGYVYGKN